MNHNSIKNVVKYIIEIALVLLIVSIPLIVFSKNIAFNYSNKSKTEINSSFSDNKEEIVDIKDTGIENLCMYIEYNYTTDNNSEGKTVKNIIGLYEKNGKSYFLLPNKIDLTNLVIHYTEEIQSISNGKINEEEKIISGNFQNESSFKVVFSDKTEKEIYILKSNIPCICINNISKEDTSYSLSEVNEGSKKTKYDVDILVEDGNAFLTNISESNAEFKGRGNFTWKLSKKGYQIKFNNKVNLFSMGEAKKWVLLPNYTDNSLMRNKLALDLAKDMNLEYTNNSNWIDLWVDGQYQGNYLLTEKVEIGKDRVNIKNDDGVLVELDNIYYEDEDLWFESEQTKSHFVYKEAKDDKDDEETKKRYLDNFEKFVNSFEKELYSDNKNWEEIKKYIDVDSFIKYYFIQEFSENKDVARSSTYMYRYGTDTTDKIYIGPVWDFDITLGNFDKADRSGNPEIDYISDITEYDSLYLDWYYKLLEIPEFRKAVSDMYTNEIKDVLDTSVSKIDKYEEQLQMSAKMNFIKWSTQGTDSLLAPIKGHKNKETYAEEVEYLRDWVRRRTDYLYRRYNKNSNINRVKYMSYIQGMDWEGILFQEGETSGTIESSLKIERIKINLLSFNEKFIDKNASVQYQVLYRGENEWEDDWKKDGQVAGTEGKDIRAIRIKLCDEEGNLIDDYSVKYRCHFKNGEWQAWLYDGESDDIKINTDRILDGIQIIVEEKT